MASVPDVNHHPLKGPHAPLAEEKDHLAAILEHMVNSTVDESDPNKLSSSVGTFSPLAPGTVSKNQHGSWWKKFWPEHLWERLDKLFAEYHMGNYVAIRAQNGRDQVEIFESMPIYVRVGMHLLFFGSKNESLLRFKTVEDLLRTLSIKQGRVYDDSSNPKAVLEHIQSFIQTYSIDLTELALPDPASYACFNDFFSRKLKAGARVIAEPTNDRIISSSADCRLTVFDSVDEAKELWIKGQKFHLAGLLGDPKLAEGVFTPGSDIVIFRLAPADYHRFHWPVGPAVLGPTKHLDGAYYTVNPQAINENFDVFTSNRRDVTVLDWQPNGLAPIPVAYVAVGAMLVGSIGWDNGVQGTQVIRGDPAGYYAYGGSTSICVFPPSAKIKWDADLLVNSRRGIETMVRVGDRLGLVDESS